MIRGYTLIEILISLSIVGLIFYVGYAGFRDFARRQALISSARELASDIRLAQGQSLAGKKPEGCDSTLQGYNFRVVSNSSYEVEAVCGTVTIKVKSKTLVSGITISTPEPNPILFKPVGLGNNIPSGVTATVVVSSLVSGESRTVFVSSGGEIYSQ